MSLEERLAELAMDLHGHGYRIAGAIFGIQCVLLGSLLWRSPRFPQILGLLMALAGAGKGALCLYRLIRGVRPPERLEDVA
jgi:hypothetical protein